MSTNRVHVIRPPERADESLECASAIFLAGPIIGAPDWQSEAAAYTEKWQGPDIIVANPRRPGPFTDDTFDEQVDWEHEHIARACDDGVMLFWLPISNGGMPGDYWGSYAKTTRFELGWMFGLRQDPKRRLDLVLGIEKGFPGRRYLVRTFEKMDPSIIVQSDLEITIRNAMDLLSIRGSEP